MNNVNPNAIGLLEKSAPSEVIVSVAVPFYNEEEGMGLFFERIVPLLESITPSFEIVCINDGSKDNTWNLLKDAALKDSRIRAFDLSRNFGKEAALSAALDHCRGKAIIPIDADLQDPPELIADMVAKWKEGFEVVVAKRKTRGTDSFGKQFTALSFYRIFNWMAEIPIPANAGDFRLIDRKVLLAMEELKEQNRFMKGLFAWVGFKTCTIEFDRDSRAAGTSKWKRWKLWNFALDGIFAFSTLPLKIWIYFGGFISLLSFVYGGFLIIRTLISGNDVPGYASLMVVMLFLGGNQLIGLGILGEYLGRIYKEVKKRPLYLIRESTDPDSK